MSLKLLRLEERIVLDAAVVDASAAISDLADSTDSLVDGSDTNSHDSDTDDATSQGSASGDTEQDSSNAVVRVLAISSDVDDPQVLASAAMEGVLTYVYDADSSDLDAILADIAEMLDGQQADSIAFASHSSIAGQFLLSGDYLVSSDTLASDTALAAFWEGVGELVEDGGSLDILSCGAASGDTGTATLEALEDLTGVDVFGSDDATGGEDAGGDWILEVGDVDLTERYFDADVLADYDGILASVWMVTDLNESNYGEFTIHESAEVNGVWIVSATAEGVGRELFTYDEANDTFTLLKDIYDGSSSSSASNLYVYNGLLYFQANDGTHGRELWVSDGTEDGTVLLKDINPGSDSSDPSKFCKAGGYVYFTADDGTHGTELWRTSGTESGTTLVLDINPGSDSSDPEQLTEISGPSMPFGGTYLYFTAYNETYGRELWISISGATYMVEDINPGSASGNPQDLTVTGDLPATRCLFYTADDGTHGRELWVTSSNGTHIVEDLVEGSGSGGILDLCEYGGDLYLVVKTGTSYGYVRSELWWHNGYGIECLTSLNESSVYSSYTKLQDMGSYMVLMGGRVADLYATWTPIALTYNGYTHTITNLMTVDSFTTDSGIQFIDGDATDYMIYDLYIYTMTSSGIDKIDSVSTANAAAAVVVGDYLFFSKDSNLFRIDSSGSVTQVYVESLDGENDSSNVSGLINVNGTLYFYADADGGTGLWMSDGTEAGTVFLKALNIDADTFTVMDGTLYFVANDVLWTTDGTAAGTVSIVNGYSSIDGDLYVGDGVLYFRAKQSGGDMLLFKSDGTEAGTVSLDTVDTLPSWAGAVETMLYVDGYLYYAYRSGHSMFSLKRTDGTEDGTITLFESVLVSDNIFFLGSANGEVYLYILGNYTTGDTGEVWRTDGTVAGAVLLDYMPDYIYNAVEYNGELYYQVLQGGVAELWKTDGTEAGTVLVKVLGGDTISDETMQVIDGLLYFSASNASQGVELWTSDGTEAGTAVLKDINSGSGSSSPTDFTLLDGYVYFTANDGVNGRELWRTDGTEAGTVLVSDVKTGSASGLPSSAYLTVMGDELYFAAEDGRHGVELWTYGTRVGDDDFSFYEDVGTYSGNLFVDNGNGADSDNGGTLILLTANGSTAGIGSRLGNGTLTVNANGDFTYTIDANGYDYLTGGESVILSFSYTTIVNGITCTGNVTFTIMGNNTAPVAVNDTVSNAYENTVSNYLISQLLGNDSDPEGDDLTLVTVSSLSSLGAIVTFNSTHVTYNPNGVAAIEALGDGETLTDTFTYTIRDKSGATSTATVTFTVNGRQEQPEISGISDWSTAEGTVNAGYQAIAASATVTDTDSADFDGGRLCIYFVDTGLAEDCLTVMSGVYDTYVDGSTGATIRLSILLVGDEVYYVKESQALGSTNWVEEVNLAFATVNSDGQAGATLDLRFNANATTELVQALLRGVGYANTSDTPTEYRTLLYDLKDGDGGVNYGVYQVIQVTAENDGPVTGTVASSTDEDTTLTFTVADLLAPASDPEGNGISFDSLSATSASGVTLTLVDGVITYAPATSATVQAMTEGATAQDTFTYTLIDSEGATSTGTVTIDLTGINDAPEISGLSDWTTSENTANASYQYINTSAATVLDAEGLDLDGGVLRIDYADGGQAEEWLRFSEVTYDVTSTTRTRIYITGTNVQLADEVYNSATGTWSSSGTRVIGTINSSNCNGTALVITFNQRAETDMVEAILEAIQYRNTSDDPAEYRTLSYTLSDGDGQTSSAAEQVIRVTPDNDAPTAVDDTAFTNKDTALTLTGADLAVNDTDPDSDSLYVSAVVATSALGATVTLNADGSVTYDTSSSPTLQALTHGATTTDTFTYTISDGNGGTDTATVTVTVTGSNAAPTATDDTVSTSEDAAITTGNVLNNDTDPDAGDTLVVDSLDTTSTQGLVTDNGDGTFDYDPNGRFEYLNAGETATDTFSYTVSDGLGGTDTATVTVTITGANDDPTTVDDDYATDEDTSFTTGNVLDNDTDPDDTLTVTAVNTSGTLGTVTYNGDGTFDYDPNGQFDALARGATTTDSFTYTVSDGHGGTSTATVTITINGLQEAPTTVDDSGYSVNEDILLNVAAPGVLANDSGDGCSVSVGSYDMVSAYGASVTMNLTTGKFTYDPTTSAQLQALAQGETLTDTFTYLILDQYGMWSTQEATVEILVTGVNDAPQAVDDAATTTGSATVTGNLLDNDVDVDHGAALELDTITVDGTTYTFTAGATHFTVTLGLGTLQVWDNGDYLFDPGSGYASLSRGQSALETFNYTVRDEHGTPSPTPATVTLNIQGENEDTQPINTPDGLFPDRALREDTANGPAPGGIGISPGWNQVNGSSRGADQDVYIPSHGQALAMGLHLMGNRDTPYGPAYPDKSFDLESLLPNRDQTREAFNNALDMIPDVGQLTKIALKNFNVDILDIVAEGDAPATQAGLRDLVHDIEMLVARLNWTEMARFQDVIEMWIKELKDQVAALRYADVDAKALMERLDALLEHIAAPAELEPL